MDVIIYDLPERAEEIAVDQHEQGAPLEVALATAGRIAAAEKLRELADYHWEPEDVAPAVHAVCAALRASADELDPDGAR